MEYNRKESQRRLAQRLLATHHPLALSEFADELIVRQAPEYLANTIASAWITSVSCYTKIIAFVDLISTRITPPFVIISGLQLSLPWCDVPAQLLPDPADPFAPEIYRFPDERSGGFDCSQVISQSGKTMRPGVPISGYLLAYHPDPLPESFRHRTQLCVTLTVVDQFGEPYSRELSLLVDRSSEWKKPTWLCRPKSRRGCIFDKPDFVAVESTHQESSPAVDVLVGSESRS